MREITEIEKPELADMRIGSHPIDMLTVDQTSVRLQLDHTELLMLVNRDELACYLLGGQLRFRYRDVESLASRRAIAA